MRVRSEAPNGYKVSVFNMQGSNMLCLHFLVHVGAVQYVGNLHAFTVHIDFSRPIVEFRTHIPEFEDMKALLGANGDTNNGIFRVGANKV